MLSRFLNKLFSQTNVTENPQLKVLYTRYEECFVSNETHNTIVQSEYDENAPRCPKTFDGFSCWDETPSNTTVVQNCPELINGFDPSRTAFKECLENGTWLEHPESKKVWTNYTTCIDYDDLRFRNVINNMYVGGYAISLIALILSLMIFVFLRHFQYKRTRIHANLFISFILNNIMWIVWYKTVVDYIEVVQENTIWCQSLHILTYYHMMTSYMWMFCEGLHLHVGLVSINEYISVRSYCAIGWAIPALVVALYTGVRMQLRYGTERCWMDQSHALWIIVIAVVIILTLSFLFLVNVIRVLLKKMQPPASNQPNEAAKKAARATATLVIYFMIPLYGLHFILIPFQRAPESIGEKIYQVVSALLTSLQGLCVSILFCFTNNDVKTALTNYLARYKRKTEAIQMTGITTGESAVNPNAA
ncbi:neuropeptide receptor B4 isoform X1 [Bombyx mori]|uniref:Neuropeptide receptor B4 n=1 Tax=Bombyx mori TaxID=7091 RepID=B3XXQ2_BOMMO|nr:neuropeptide receptor B4 [Bombyx mori]XP_012548880.1 neuropeptide receptor B4 isoform X1 [Bombyx mori]BAG68438.1 neuropeptide receptor B4 [Bombyx mori]